MDMKQPQPPFHPVPFAPIDLVVDHLPGGEIVMNSQIPLTLREPHLPAYLKRQANQRPNSKWLAQRLPGGGPWRSVTYGEGHRIVDALTQAILDLKVPQGRAAVVLSDNSIEHALFMFAAMQARLPVVPISPAYSLVSKDFSKLRAIMQLVEPGLIFVQDGQQYAKALTVLDLPDVPVVCVDNVGPGQVRYAKMCKVQPTLDVGRSIDGIDIHAPAKIMFTSGSTGVPKGVPLSHHSIVTASESNLTITGRLEEGIRRRLDWAPWSHVFGATAMGFSVIEGCTFYIDDGKPTPEHFKQTMLNLAEVQPDLFMSVPSAIAMLVEAMEKNEEFAHAVLKNLTSLGYGGASLPADVATRLQTLSVRHTGRRLPIVCGYGATETCGAGAFVYWPTEETGFIGLPQPGLTIKLVPREDDRYEVRLAGDAVMRGYLKRPELNAEVFDAEGFYRTSDCVRFRSANEPTHGLVFDGRLSEEFKLQTGVFIRAGALRNAVIEATAPMLRDVVICGENQPFVTALVWLNPAGASAVSGRIGATLEELTRDPRVISALVERLREYNSTNKGASRYIRRVRLLDQPASIDAGEITDKGSINQRAVQRNRKKDVKALYADGVSLPTLAL